MIRMLRRLLALVLCAAFVLCAAPAALAADTGRDQTASFLAAQTLDPTAGTVYGDWLVFALARTGSAVPEGFFSAYLTRAEKLLAEHNGALRGPVTGTLRLCLALEALGQELTDVGGYDLLAVVKDTGRICRTTVIGPAVSLLILNNAGGDPVCEQTYLRHLLDTQLEDGGWALSGTVADPDTTAMALQALSFYPKEAEAAISRGVARLSTLQQPGGGYTAWGASTSESISQVLMALCMLGISPDDARFVKNGRTLLDALLSFRLEDGSFRHLSEGGYDVMATHQAMLALESLRRAEEGLPNIYLLTDPAAVDRGFAGLPGRYPAVAVPGRQGEAPAFSDIAGLAEEQAILALAGRGILEGMGGGRFEPEGLLNRAQFCAMAVRALGLPQASSAGFSDVPEGLWYSAPVNAAAAFGAVEGVGGGRFAPLQPITRQQAAVLVARLAKACGLNVRYSADACRNVLSQFGDWQSCAPWAQEALAFCCDRGILDTGEADLCPGEAVTRAEAARMFFALLDEALLLEN